MSYLKYVEYKEKIKAKINLDDYASHIRKLVEQKIKEKCRLADLLCLDGITSFLKDAHYPKSESLRIALACRDPRIIDKQINDLKEWSDLEDNAGCRRLAEELEIVEASLFLEVTPSDLENLVHEHEEHCYKRLSSLANKVESALRKTKWKNYEIEIKAVPVQDSFSVSKALLIVNEEKSIIVDMDSLEGAVLEGAKYYDECTSLITALKREDSNSILTLYIEAGQNEKALKEKKFELCSGIKSYLSEGTFLSNEVSNNCWKIRIERKGLVPSQGGYTVSSEEAQIKFLEKVYERQHG